MVRAFYTWNNTWPREAFESGDAHAKHVEHVQQIWKEFKDQVQQPGRLVYLDKKSRLELEAVGTRFIGHAAADAGETGPEDF